MSREAWKSAFPLTYYLHFTAALNQIPNIRGARVPVAGSTGVGRGRDTVSTQGMPASQGKLRSASRGRDGQTNC